MEQEVLFEREEVLKEIIGQIDLQDTRINRHKKYSLAEIFLLVLCAQICDYSTFREYEHYGKIKADFLKKILPYKEGMPSRSTIARILALFHPKILEQLFITWAEAIIPKNREEQRVLAVDGKTHRGARGDNIHLVNVYDTNNGLCLGQEKVDEKSNEITAIPELLEALSIKGQIVSIDAMGCQKKIAEKIVSKKADYFLALKGNHGDFFDDVKTYFNDSAVLKNCDFFETIDAGHGRIEKRRCYATSTIEWIKEKSAWLMLKSIVMIEATRYIGDKKSVEKRYFITSLTPNAQKALVVSRAHWGIENSLNWVLDVVFKEDNRIIWNKNIAQNEALIRRVGLNLAKRYQAIHPANKKHEKIAIKTLRKSLIGDDFGMFTLLKG